MKIPFMKTPVFKNDRDYLLKAFDNEYHMGGGDYTKKVQSYLEGIYGIKKVLLTTSCTDALEMAAFLINANEGGEFIVPSYTFSSTANAFASKGMTPVYCDIREDTLNIDETKIESLITPKTKAIVPIHYAGIPAEMDTINSIAKKCNLVVIEDAAQAVNSVYKGKFPGALCDLGTYSFHATKVYSCGEGGGLTMNDERFFQRSEFLWEKGTDRSLVVQGLKNKYSWVDYGSSFLPSDLLAAMLLSQLESREEMQAIRKKVYDGYEKTFSEFKTEGLLMPHIPNGIQSNYHAFWLVFPTEKHRQIFLQKSIEKEVIPYIGYIPLHSSPMGAKLGGLKYDLPVTDKVASAVVRLPFYLMNNEEITFACDVMAEAVKAAFSKA